jgi:hypothetical protein
MKKKFHLTYAYAKIRIEVPRMNLSDLAYHVIQNIIGKRSMSISDNIQFLQNHWLEIREYLGNRVLEIIRNDKGFVDFISQITREEQDVKEIQT